MGTSAILHLAMSISAIIKIAGSITLLQCFIAAALISRLKIQNALSVSKSLPRAVRPQNKIPAASAGFNF